MRIDASFPSVALMRGFCRSRVFELVARNCATVGGIVSEKLFPFKVLRLFSAVEVLVVVVVDVVPVGVEPVVVDVDVLFPLLTFGPVKLTEVPCGGRIPSWRNVLRSTSMIMASTSTSGFALSRRLEEHT